MDFERSDAEVQVGVVYCLSLCAIASTRDLHI